MEPMDILGKSKEDVSLPKSTMFKIIKEMLPPDVRVARDTQDLLVECCVEFINLLSSESNDVCNREDRRTIAPEHVLKALEGSFDAMVKLLHYDLKVTGSSLGNNFLQSRIRLRTIDFFLEPRIAGALCTGLHLYEFFLVLGFGEYIEEVYAAYQQHKLETLDSPKGTKFGGTEMTEEQAAAEQQRMFAEARARMNNGVSSQKMSESDPTLES